MLLRSYGIYGQIHEIIFNFDTKVLVILSLLIKW